MTSESRFLYRGNRLREISFPLGGIGTGSIGLAGNGRLIDWEIYNRPNKGSINGFSHFSIKAERDGRVVDARILQSDLHPPYTGNLNGPMYNSFGFGPQREYLTGLPHFRELTFEGKFPAARLSFEDASFPGQARLMAFNPFIPLNEFDSGIPAAFFEIEVTNTSGDELTYTLVGALSNPLPETQIHQVKTEPGRAYLHLASTSAEAPKTGLGDLTLAVEGGDLSAQAYWFRGAWFDNLEIYWQEMTQPGGLKARHYAAEEAGANNTGALAARLTLKPGESGKARFVIAWNFPTFENYWNQDTNAIVQEKGLPTFWKNYYATQFQDSLVSARYALEEWTRLYGYTEAFQKALYESTLEPVVIEAVAANLAVMKSPTVLRLEEGTFYGFEGCHPNSGCCEGSCTHVWNYAQAVSFLFPALERSMRAVDFDLNQRQDGAMRFRLPLPPVLKAEDFWVFHPCADGQLGNVLKAYADWKICGDGAWLEKYWPAIQKAIEFAWSPDNEYRWDPEKKGVLTGRMHHTLDMELFGPDAWLNGFYLAALKAGAEMAEALNLPEKAAEYREVFARGKAWVDQYLFNGEYYHQIIDLEDRAIPAGFGVESTYWNAEHGEIKYQIGEGCEIDQLLAQFHANIYGLGEIFDPAQARQALESLYRYNFQAMRGAYNPCRVFALNDEAGLVMCAWPEHVRKPMIPIPYSQEVMTGFEYAAAVLMIQNGLVEQGLAVTKAVRDRYDGEKRNPWNEIECGSNYARPLASYALLTAFSGFEFDLTKKRIGFNPILSGADQPFQAFWSLSTAWGTFRQTGQQVELDVLYGILEVKQVHLPFIQGKTVQSAGLGGLPIRFQQEGDEITFTRPIRVGQGFPLTLDIA